MASKSRISQLLVVGLLLLNAGLRSAASDVVGMLGGSRNATLAGDPSVADQAVFNGDELKVTNGAANVALVGGSRILVGSNTAVSFHQNGREVATDISRGRMEFFYPGNSVVLPHFNAVNLSITPKSGSESLGEVIVARHSMIVSALRGSLHVEGAGRGLDLTSGQEMLLAREPVSSLSGAAAPFSAVERTAPGGSNLVDSQSHLQQLCNIEEQFERSPFDALLDDICDKHQNKIKQLCSAEAKDDRRPSPFLPENSPLDQAIDAVCVK